VSPLQPALSWFLFARAPGTADLSTNLRAG
jgi:hypothetical protein